MKKLLFTLSVLFAASTINAQLVLPQASPKAAFTQTVGLTDISIDYSSPGVKGRVIWGEVVPFEKLWRAGANAATKFTFSRDVTIGNTSVIKGSYSFFVIPSKDEWTLILNKDITASTDEYKMENDVLRMKVKPQTISSRERLAYLVSNFDDNQGMIDLEWEKVKVSLPFTVATGEQSRANIKSSISVTWRTYNSAARYMLDQKEFDSGLTYVNQSISLSNEWLNNWTKAQLLAAKGDYKQALQFAQSAKDLGDKSDGFFFKTQVEQALTDWKNKK